ncbi:hypothetical protein D3C77_357300 [compost metagenome]
MRQLASPFLQAARRPQGREQQTVNKAEHDNGNPADKGVQVDHVEQSSFHLHVAVDRQPFEQAGEDDAEQKRRQQAAQENRQIPGVLPARVLYFTPEFKRHPASDQGQQQYNKRCIVAAEQRGIPVWECREHRAACRQQPNFVRIPEGTDRIDQHPSLHIIFS